jgi:hypothetical protein
MAILRRKEPSETAFIAKIREQILFMRDDEYAYDELHVYVSGISEPWVFGPDDEFDFDDEEILVVRLGPTNENENEGVPEYVFPLQQVVATELAISEE